MLASTRPLGGPVNARCYEKVGARQSGLNMRRLQFDHARSSQRPCMAPTGQAGRPSESPSRSVSRRSRSSVGSSGLCFSCLRYRFPIGTGILVDFRKARVRAGGERDRLTAVRCDLPSSNKTAKHGRSEHASSTAVYHHLLQSTSAVGVNVGVRGLARKFNRLSARAVAALRTPGRHADGGGLYVVVNKSGSKQWVFLFRFGGRLREMGLGGVSAVSLAEARKLAETCRAKVAKGVNPIEARKTELSMPTFGECVEDFLVNKSGEWRNEKHRAQWRMTLTRYTSAISSMPVNTIETEDVLKVLKPIWQKTPETASRLRGRIERVLDAARAKRYRSGENPARWRGHLDTLLPARQKLTRGHHAAMPYRDVSAFIARLRERHAVAALALEFTILTAARSGEALGARWDEIDPDAKVWMLPASRMKAARQHRVPLSARAMAIVEQMQTVRTSVYIFPSHREGRQLSFMSLEMVMRRMNVPFTVHGFRSAFRDWCGETTDFPREVAEAALAHVVGDATEQAYRRGDALEKRRKLMDD
jgi:integrase